MVYKKSKVLSVISLAIILIISGFPMTSADAAQRYSYANEMNKARIMTFEITVEETAWQSMLENAMNEEYIPVDIKINGKLMKNVGIRPKGNSSLAMVYFDESTDKYSFKIKFDEYVKGQTWMGLDKIVINNLMSDATGMKEYISYDIMNYIGVKSPLFAYADISVNGKNQGFYLAVEDISEGYLNRAFWGRGVLYKPHNDDMQVGKPEGEELEGPGAVSGSAIIPIVTGSAITPIYPVEAETPPGGFPGGFGEFASKGVSLQYIDDNVSSYSAIFNNAETNADESDFQRVITALKCLNEGVNLETYIDVRAVLKYFAAHTVVVNADSYISSMGHNYYLYESNGRIRILPWDYNLAFGGFMFRNASDVVNFPIDTPVFGVKLEERPLLGKILEVPEYRRLYHQYLQRILLGYFAGGRFEQTVDKLHYRISEYMKEDPSSFYTYEEYLKAITELKKLGALRAKSIQGQLCGIIPATTEGQKENPDKLVDASTIDLAALGSISPMGSFTIPAGLDMETFGKAMEIIIASQGSELTQEQRNQLYELGLTDEQIEQLLALPKPGPFKPAKP